MFIYNLNSIAHIVVTLTLQYHVAFIIIAQHFAHHVLKLQYQLNATTST